MDFDEKKYYKYLTLFGLDPGYTEDGLKNSYRVLAKLNHPDLNRDSTSEMRMVILNDGYKYLLEFKDYTLESKAANSISGDVLYNMYQKAFSIMKEAFEHYYGDDNNSSKGDIELLKDKLAISKKEFAKLINDHPYNLWTDDAIDKICSINKWL